MAIKVSTVSTNENFAGTFPTGAIFSTFFSKTAFTAHTRPFRLTFFPIWSDRRIFFKFFLVIINALVRIPTFFAQRRELLEAGRRMYTQDGWSFWEGLSSPSGLLLRQEPFFNSFQLVWV